MAYPSLLYTEMHLEKPIPVSVFEDLQLLNFISKDTAKTVRYPCSPSDRTSRRNFFASMKDKKTEEALKNLRDVSAELDRLNALYENSRSNDERYVLFLELMKNDEQFTSLAASLGASDRISALFSSWFASRLGGRQYTEMRNEIGDIAPELEKAFVFSLHLCRQDVCFDAEVKESLPEAVRSAGRELGIDSVSASTVPERRISPDILRKAAVENPSVFKKLESFCKRYKPLYSKSITFYHAEIDFYLSLFGLIKRAEEIGIPFCAVSESTERKIRATEVYDISLLAKGETKIIPNDTFFSDSEPFFFLTGANGGGKTTYLRAIGILTLLHLLGCPVPARSAEIGGIDTVYTHFPRDERFDGSGRFVEEDRRVRSILEKADGHSLILLNETYSTTNEENAIRCTSELAEKLNRDKRFGLYITHQHGLKQGNIPYLQVMIDDDDNNRRTFRVVRNRNEKGSFAEDILLRYGLDEKSLEKRFGKLEDNR